MTRVEDGPTWGILRSVPAGSLHEGFDRRLEVPDGGGGPLVTPTTVLRCLDRGQVVQQRRDGAVGIHGLDDRSSPHTREISKFASNFAENSVLHDFPQHP